MNKPERIFITGASGYVGAKIFDYLRHFGYPVSGSYHSTKLFDELVSLDVTLEEDVKTALEAADPSIVIHTAANASSGWCEEHPKEAYDLNVNATKYVVDYVKKHDKRMIFLSSFAAYNPSNVYGQNKVEAEELVKKLKNYLIIRPSLVVGESPNTQASKLFNQIVHMITDRSQIKLDSSWKFEATYLRHLAEIIYTAIENSEINQLTIPVVAKGLTSRYQIAQELLFDYEITVEEIDQNRIIPLPELDLSMFEKFDLFTYTYDEIIAEMKKEIRHCIQSED